MWAISCWPWIPGNSGSTIVFVVTDTMYTDTVVGWDVNYLLKIDEVRPAIVAPTGVQQHIVLYGAGFSPLKRPKMSFLGVNISEINLRPEVRIKNYTRLLGLPFWKTETFFVTPLYINPEGTKMVVEVPGEALKRTINEIISMDVIHPNRTEGEQHGVYFPGKRIRKTPWWVAAMPRLSERGAFNPQAGYDKRDIEL